MIRAPRPEDIGRLAEIHVFGWRNAYLGIVPDSELFVATNVAQRTKFWEWILQNKAESALVYDDGVVKGFCLHAECRDEDAIGDYEIQAIYVEPAFLGQGVGTALLTRAEDAARRHLSPRVRLWALEKNPLGPPFYAKRGYTVDGAVKIIEEWDGAREIRFTKEIVHAS